MGQPFAENPPIEFAASRLRELRVAALVVAATPRPQPKRDDELRRIALRYQEWLLIAASLVEIDAPTGNAANLSVDAVRQVEELLAEAGWQLDG